MIYFNCDYNEGCHPRILERLAQTNYEQSPGYGEDAHCEKARQLIRAACGLPEEPGVHFLVGGTQVNAIVIRHALRPHQGVICSKLGHIHVHETGAVEAGGHKCLALPCGREGKIDAGQIAALCREHYSPANPTEHTVQPGMVYLSHPTENGALYSRRELEAIRAACDEFGLFLYVDGARLGYGLTARGADVTLPDLARCCDAFTIGGTKCGALFGEALVIPNPTLNRDFRYAVKQGGGMLAKGRLLGIQFEALFSGHLYENICRRANELAYDIAAAFLEAGCPEFTPSDTNQQFFVLPNSLLERLSKRYVFQVWEVLDEEHSAVRVAASWATKQEDARQLIDDIKKEALSHAGNL